MSIIIDRAANKVVDCLVALIEPHLSYVFDYDSNLDDLQTQVDQLDAAMGGRKQDVDKAEKEGYEIDDEVQKWLTDAAKKSETAKNFIQHEEAANTSCFNVMSRYHGSREAKKQTREIEEEIKNNNFSRVFCQRHPQRIWSTCLRGIEPLKSRKDKLSEIMEALKSDDFKLIGVWGMGGVGKTTLANQVMQLAEENKLFDKVIMPSNISEEPKEIQGSIATVLGWTFLENEHDVLVRKDRLRKSLNSHGRFLLILDELWVKLDLELIGIPYHNEGCKVLLTSRNHKLLSVEKGTQKNFQVKKLPGEEAWSLFKKIAGDAVENLELRPTARQVADKCDCLPVAITTIAKALRPESSVAVWKNALDELERCEPTNIEGVSDNVYSCLELSYKHLKGDEVKRLFLFCAMLGSSDIFMDRLLQYAMSLDVFQHNLSLEQATNKLVTLVNILKDSSLLLDTEDWGYYRRGQFFFEPDEFKIIRMHGVVRDVARSIASKDPKQFVLKEAGGFEEWQSRDDELMSCTHISLSDPKIKTLPERLVCPKLEFFFLEDYSYPRCLKIPDTFFEEMKQLKVLHLHNVDLRELPPSLNALSKLQTLCLTGCDLGDVAIIGALKQLRVLSFEGSAIQRLPEEIMQLNDLRVLDLSWCQDLRVMPRNVISSLSRLEYLSLADSFAEWGSKRFDNDGETNACLCELTNLSNLKTLLIRVGNFNLLPEDRFFENLNRYQIVVGQIWRNTDMGIRCSRVLMLDEFNSHYDRDNCFSKLLKTTEFLELRKLAGVNEFLELRKLAGVKQSLCESYGEFCPKLTHLCIEDSADIRYVFNSVEGAPCAFPMLESLDLAFLHRLAAVWYRPITNESFRQIRKLRLRNCRGLKWVMWLSTAQEGEFEFPHLKNIELEYLPQLIYFCSTETSLIKDSSTTNDAQTPFFDQKVAFPSLETLRMFYLDKVGGTLWQDQLQAGSFRELKSLEIIWCHKLRNVFAVDVAKGLENLKALHVGDCEVEEIVSDENGDGATSLLFPKLTSLRLDRLGKLRCFYGGKSPRPLEWPLLKELKVCDCYKVEKVFQGIGSEAEADINGLSAPPPLFFVQKDAFPSLESLRLDGLNMVEAIWQDQLHAGWFRKLKSLGISGCRRLRNVYLLRSLETLKIEDCSSLDEIFYVESNEEIHDSVAAPLRELSLEKLPCLKSICSNDPQEWAAFQNLQVLTVMACPLLTPYLQISGLYYQNLQNIKKLVVRNCENLIYLVTPSMAQSLVQLKVLDIAMCDMMTEVVGPTTEVVGPEGDNATYEIVFPKLETLQLYYLLELKSFCSASNYAFKFPSLKIFDNSYCDKMEFFCRGNLTAPELEGDLNIAIQLEKQRRG